MLKSAIKIGQNEFMSVLWKSESSSLTKRVHTYK